MRNPTLRRRLLFSLTRGTLTTAIVGGLVFSSFAMREKVREMQNFADHTAEVLAHRIRLGDLNPNDEGWTTTLLSDPRISRISVYSDSGATLVQDPPDATLPAVATRLGLEKDWRSVLGPEGVIVAVAIDLSTIIQHGLLMVLGVTLTSAGAIGLARLFSRRAHRAISTQLLDLSIALNAVSSHQDYSIRALRRTDDEIGILADTLNHMLTQIELQDLQLKDEVERSEAAKLAKSQFLATMSHEIRTPINAILGMTQLMLDTALNSEQRDFARTVGRSAEGLLSIINNILDFSKGEASRHQIEHITFNTAQVIDECIETVAIVACEKSIELICQVDDRVPRFLKGDPARIRRVLLNLLTNALKFTSTGEIVIRVALDETVENAASLHFEVQDTGIGIPEDRVDRLFKSFPQVDASNDRQYGGSGLGLAISKQLIEAMGGSIYVRTREGQGSLFGFKLILSIDEKLCEREENKAPKALRVLVADPNATSRSAISQMLREGNLIVTAASGAEGRQMLLEATKNEKPFDLALLDVRISDAFLAPSTGNVDPPPTSLIMLAPVNQLASASAVDWHGRVSCLAKPVRRQDLLWCIAESRKADPVLVAPALARAKLPIVALDAKDQIVLVAEDDPVNQKITSKFLDKIGISWRMVATGKEALDTYRTGNFDLILMDLQMPVMDGLEATTAIRRLEVLSETHIPIIALTSNVLEDDRNRAYRAGFDDYLLKPIKLEELEQAVRKWLTRAKHTAGNAADHGNPNTNASTPLDAAKESGNQASPQSDALGDQSLRLAR